MNGNNHPPQLSQPSQPPQPPQMVSPVPMTITFGAAEVPTPTGLQRYLVTIYSTPIGQSYYFEEPDIAVRQAEEKLKLAKALRMGLVLPGSKNPPNFPNPPNSGN